MLGAKECMNIQSSDFYCLKWRNELKSPPGLKLWRTRLVSLKLQMVEALRSKVRAGVTVVRKPLTFVRSVLTMVRAALTTVRSVLAVVRTALTTAQSVLALVRDAFTAVRDLLALLRNMRPMVRVVLTSLRRNRTLARNTLPIKKRKLTVTEAPLPVWSRKFPRMNFSTYMLLHPIAVRQSNWPPARSNSYNCWHIGPAKYRQKISAFEGTKPMHSKLFTEIQCSL